MPAVVVYFTFGIVLIIASLFGMSRGGNELIARTRVISIILLVCGLALISYARDLKRNLHEG